MKYLTSFRTPIILSTLLFLTITTYSQNVVWKKKIYSSNSLDVKDIVSDSSGNILVLGNVVSTSNNQIFVTKYTTNGDSLWTFYTNSNTQGLGGVYLTKSAIYIYGAIRISSHNDGSILKLDNNGNLKWTIAYVAPGNDGSNGIAQLSPNSFVCLQGSDIGNGSYSERVLQFDSLGNYSVLSTYVNQNPGDPGLSEILSDKQGNYYISGTTSYQSSNTSMSSLVAKYNGSGSLQWSYTYDSTGLNITPYGLLVSKNGSSYQAGQKILSNGKQDIYILKLDVNGNLIWNKTINNSATEIPTDMIFDKNGNLLICGQYLYASGNSNFFTVKYDTNGNQLWQRIFDKAGLNDSATVILSDEFNNVYVGGLSDTGGTTYSSILIKYDGNGNYQWNTAYPNNNPSEGLLASSVYTTPNVVSGAYVNGSVYLGSSSYNGSSYGTLVVRYGTAPLSGVCQTTVYQYVSVTDTLRITSGVLTGLNGLPNNFGTVKIYPNPTHNELNFLISSPSTSFVIKVTSIQGQLVYNNVMNQSSFQIDLSTLSKGLYYIQVLDNSSNILETKKLVLD